jgi:hypothetical protein
MDSSRRDFLKYSALAAGSAFLFPDELLTGQKKPGPHEEVLKKKFDLAKSEGLADKSMSEVMGAIGQSFLEQPYKEHTLEQAGKERLVINLKEFDCVTFVENTLAISRCIKLKKTTFEDFKKQLQLIRYRGGKISGYPSRLHYFSDWIDDNEKKGIVKNVAQELGGSSFDKQINFMSTHRDSYKLLKTEQFYTAIKSQEAELNTRKHFFIQKQNVQAAREQILDGDIIGIATTIDGLDITHTGMAIRFQGYLRLLHAPLSGGSVQITKRTIVDYLGQEESRTGIMIARPVEPTA